MKNKNFLIGLFLSSLSLYNCQEKNNNNITFNEITNNKMDTINILPILIKQIEAGNDQTYGCYSDYGEEDLDALVSIEDTILKNNGYKTLDINNFNKKVKNIFGRIIDNNSQTKYLKIDTYEYSKCNKELKFYPYSVDAQYLYISKNNKFITFFYALPQVLDYIKLYPEVSKYEKENIIIKDYIEEIEIEASQWKDDKNLPQQRRFNQQLLISRNKYLFNDDKSQFSWLITNDEYFMESLVKTFGYSEDKKLLRWAFDKQGFSNYQKYPDDDFMENYGKFLWTQQCNGEIKIHQNTLDLIKEKSEPTVNKDKYLLNLAEYINYLTLSGKELEINFEQKAKIAAHLLVFGEQYKYNPDYGYNQMFLGKFIYYQDIDKKYKKEFERNNYYNLLNLKKWYLQAEQERDMFENDESLPDDPQPVDYVYRASYYTRKK